MNLLELYLVDYRPDWKSGEPDLENGWTPKEASKSRWQFRQEHMWET